MSAEYGEFNKKAFALKNPDFLRLRQEADLKKRVLLLRNLLGVTPAEMRVQNLDEAFDAYYTSQLNSAPLTAYGALLRVEPAD